MTKLVPLFVAVSFALAGSVAASAAEPAVATLQVQAGTAMTSQGGEFASAQSGKVLVPGERILLVEGATATAVYADGCSVAYSAPGIHVVAATCQATAASANGVDWAGAAKIVGGVAVGSALLENMEQVDAPPVSR